MSFSTIDRIIAREVGQLCWFLLPQLHPSLKAIANTEPFRPIWNPPDDEEIRSIRTKNPRVEYPAIVISTDSSSGCTARFVFPPIYGEALRLSDYLIALRRFIILQLTGNSATYAPLIIEGMRTIASVAPDAVMTFVDQLWRGRWAVDASEWSNARLSILIGDAPNGEMGLQGDAERLESEAVRLIGVERLLKETVTSLDEWLHETYCFLPDLYTWFSMIRRANTKLQSDELEKYDRMLDEFLADIGTTIDIPARALSGNQNLAEEYALLPLRECASAQEAVKKIRGIYRGRTIIPRVWYETVKTAVLESGTGDAPTQLPTSVIAELNNVDLSANFGQVMTVKGKEDHWMTLDGMFEEFHDE